MIHCHLRLTRSPIFQCCDRKDSFIWTDFLLPRWNHNTCVFGFQVKKKQAATKKGPKKNPWSDDSDAGGSSDNSTSAADTPVKPRSTSARARKPVKYKFSDNSDSDSDLWLNGFWSQVLCTGMPRPHWCSLSWLLSIVNVTVRHACLELKGVYDVHAYETSGWTAMFWLSSDR